MDKPKLIGVDNSENLQSARDAFSRLSPEEKNILLQEALSGSSGDIDMTEVFRAAAHEISKEKLANGSD